MVCDMEDRIESFADLVDIGKCATILREERWPDGTVHCPYCDSSNIKILEEYQKVFHRYICYDCTETKGYKTTFNEKTATMFEDSKLPLNKCFYSADLIRKETSSSQIAKDLAVDVNTARRMTMLLRSSFLFENETTIRSLLYEIESDEAYITAGSNGNNYTRPLDRAPRVRGLKKGGEPMKVTKRQY